MSFYSNRALLFIRALTPLHVGVGRLYSAHADLPVQRDEYGFPTIWSSSLKGAIKANVDKNIRKCFGPDPEELEITEFKQSQVALTDARLFLIPIRTLSGVYTYMTSPILLKRLAEYIRAINEDKANKLLEEVDKLSEKMKDRNIKAIVSTSKLLFRNTLVANEIVLTANVDETLMQNLKLEEHLPSELTKRINEKQLIVITDENNVSLNLVNRSMMIQYRVRLEAETKTVKPGALWSEEYIPSETILASLILCKRGSSAEQTQGGHQDITCGYEEIKDTLNDLKVIFIGGKETIGRGLVRIYVQ